MTRLLTLFLLLAVPFAQAADEGWRLDKEQDGIQVYTRAVEGQKIREIRGVVGIKARLSAVVAVLNDVPATPELSDAIGEAQVLQRQSAARYQIYQLLKMPWPLDNRDIVSQREIRQDAQTLAVTIADAATPDAIPPKSGIVRIQKSRQQWTLTPQADGSVLAEMRAMTDPAGPIPSSVINSMSVGAPFKSLQKLRVLVQQPKYRDARPDFIKEPPAR
ncbi:START domain-containing protein [Solimonas fluminis]|nr:START domain-containing protein [Solimonas fluminis]